MAKTEKTEAPVTEKTQDPWKTMKKVFLERGNKNEPKSLFVSVDGRDFMVPKGQEVEVPLPIARVVEMHKRAKAALMDTMAEVEDEAMPDLRSQFRF